MTFGEALFLYTLGSALACSTLEDLKLDQSWVKGQAAPLTSGATLKLGAIEPGFSADFTGNPKLFVETYIEALFYHYKTFSFFWYDLSSMCLSSRS